MYNDFPPHIRFSSLRQVFVSSAFHVGFLAVRVAMEQVVLLLLGFLLSSVTPPPIRIHSLSSGDGTKGPQEAAALRDSLSYLPATTDKKNNTF
jgi:hypothetical protein